MESHMNTEDCWERCTLEDHKAPVPKTHESKTMGSEPEKLKACSKSLYERYGTNEPYIEPENINYYHDTETILKYVYRIPGSSMCSLISSQTDHGAIDEFLRRAAETHYTVPKRMLYHFSDHAKACLEGNFREASANAIWLPDVDPDVFQWLLLWLYTGKLEVLNYYNCIRDLSNEERLTQACQVWCRVHILGERLLFDDRLLYHGVRSQLDTIIEKAKSSGDLMPLTPEIIDEVFSDSAPVQYGGRISWASASLRPFVLGHLRTFPFCTTVDFMDFVECFERDGGFAAELMRFMASEIKWAVERCEAELELHVDVAEIEK